MSLFAWRQVVSHGGDLGLGSLESVLLLEVAELKTSPVGHM